MFRVLSAFGLILLVWFWLERPTDATTVGVAAPVGGASLQGLARVIDGDTFEIAGTTVRLQGVDAPERSDQCLGSQGQLFACGRWATARTRHLIADHPLTCIDLGERTHGRTVAQCFLDGQDLGARLVEGGIVLACPRYARRHAHSAGYERIEAVAASRRVGLHAGQPPERAGFCQPRGDISPRPASAAAGQGDDDCRIKGNINRRGERIYHIPGQRDYARTRIDPAQGERLFCSEDEARAAGWRPAQR